jgi:putative ABC transport system permease protein
MWIFGLAPLDATTYAVITVMFSLVAVFASYVPARRATRVNPLVALRSE